MTYHPWRHLRRRRDLDYLPESEGDDILGSYDLAEQRIRLHPRLSQVQRRCTIAHELVHAELGHDGCQDEATEAMVMAEAARRLIAIEALAAAALVYEDDMHGMADHLWVDLDTLKARVDRRFLHPADRGYLTRRLATKEQSA